MQSIHSSIAEKGAKLFVIGSGSPEQAANAALTLGLSYPVYADPNRDSFRAAKLRKDLTSTLHPGTILNLWRSLRKGFRQGWTQGDAFQQGGAIVIGSDGKVRFRFVSSAGGQHPDPQQLLSAL